MYYICYTKQKQKLKLNKMTKELKVKKVKFNGHVIEFYSNVRSQLCAKHSRVLTSGKNKGQEKVIENYSFQNETHRNEWAEKLVNRVNSIIEAEKERKAIKVKAKSNMSNPYQVGQVFYDSWGYDQTNIDFYQIVGLKAKSVVLKKIAQRIVKDSEGFMSEYVTPSVNDFIGEELLRPIRVGVDYKGNIAYRFNASRHALSEYTYGDKGLYQSHYA